ncbi:MAG: acyl-CoA carboxylase subunit beta, partial [Bacteroidetes bacterium]
MDINFNKNEDHNKLLLSKLNKKYRQVSLGGGANRIEKHHAKGKMTARERIEFLFDKGSKSIEIGTFTGDEMYQDHGGCPSGG